MANKIADLFLRITAKNDAGAALKQATDQVKQLGQDLDRALSPEPAKKLTQSLNQATGQVKGLGTEVAKGLKLQAGMDAYQSLQSAGQAVAGALIGSVQAAADFETQLSDIGKTANVGRDELGRLSSELMRLSSSNTTNLSVSTLAEGVKDLTGAGLNLEDAVASMEALGKVATATGSELTDVTRTGFQLQNALKIKPTELKATFDALAYAGKQGAFELKDMAAFMPTIASAAGTLGITGKEGAVSLAAMMQMVRKDAPDAGQAATRLTDAMLKMTAPDAVKNFKKFGVNIEQVMKDAKANGINPMEAALAELQRITGGDAFKLSRIFGDKEAKLALMSLMKYRDEYAQLRDEAGGAAASGTVDQDFARSMDTFTQKMQSFQNSALRLGIVVGNAILPPLTKMAEALTPVIEGIVNWSANNPLLVKGIVALGAAFAGVVAALPLIATVIAASVVPAIGAIMAAALPVIAVIAAIGAAVALVIAFWPQLSSAARTAITAIESGLVNLHQAAVNQLSRMAAYIQGIPAQLAGVGSRMISTIIQGIRAKAGELTAAVRNAVAGAMQGIPGAGLVARLAGPQLPGRATGQLPTAAGGLLASIGREMAAAPAGAKPVIANSSEFILTPSQAQVFASGAAMGGGSNTYNFSPVINLAAGNPESHAREVLRYFEIWLSEHQQASLA